MWIFLYIIIAYIVVVYGLSRFLVPHMGFGVEDIPEVLPPDMEKKIAQLSSSARTARDFLEASYEFLGNKYMTGRWHTVSRLHYAFFPLERVWETSGFMHCTQSNFIMRIFLVKSGHFLNEDIRTKHIFFNFLIHQFLVVKVDGEWMNVDVGEKQRGSKLGERRYLFN